MQNFKRSTVASAVVIFEMFGIYFTITLSFIAQKTKDIRRP